MLFRSMDDTDKVRQLYDDALANGLAILPPCINSSGLRFAPVDRNTVRYGLGAVRGMGISAIGSAWKSVKPRSSTCCATPRSWRRP